MKEKLKILFLRTGNSCRSQMAEEIAEQGADEEQQLNCHKKIRDEIKAFVEKMPENIIDRIL